MPEAKRVFIKAKMNKDLEKRLIKNGEYLDARNVSVDDSEDSFDANTPITLISFVLVKTRASAAF